MGYALASKVRSITHHTHQIPKGQSPQLTPSLCPHQATGKLPEMHAWGTPADVLPSHSASGQQLRWGWETAHAATLNNKDTSAAGGWAMLAGMLAFACN